MIASDDVRRVTFDRAMRGYRCEDVDDYLRQVADGIDSLAAENDDLQKKLVILAQRIDQYRADEDTLSTTMINAQRLGENVIKEAKQKAAEIIRAANIKAEDREQRARDEVELAQQELVTIKQEADAFKKRLMDLYRQEISGIRRTGTGCCLHGSCDRYRRKFSGICVFSLCILVFYGIIHCSVRITIYLDIIVFLPIQTQNFDLVFSRCFV